jgi:hypothetical protein
LFVLGVLFGLVGVVGGVVGGNIDFSNKIETRVIFI